jgi:hypothetical protein
MVLSLASNQDHIDDYDLSDNPKPFECEELKMKKE